MNELSSKIKDLIADLLVKEFRNYGGNFEFKPQAEWVYHLATTKYINELFDFKDDSCLSKKYKYKVALEKLIENRNDYEISTTNENLQKIFVEALSEANKRLSEEYILRSEAYEITNLKKEIIILESQIEFGKPPENVNLLDKLNSRVNFPYFIMLCLTIILLLGLIILGVSTEMSVNIDFNIGEIIGGLLIGTGAAAAGISYATRKTPERNPNDRQ